DAVDRCAGDSDPDACTELREGTTFVAACANHFCAVECTGGRSITSCSGNQDSCGCSPADVAEDSNDTACTEASVKDGVCCTDGGWPQNALFCACHPFACQPTADGCSCDTDRPGPTNACTGKFCCVTTDGTQCHCGNKPCNAVLDVQVDACNVAVAGCIG